MSTSRQYKSLGQYLRLSDYSGIHHTVNLATIIYDELAYWTSFLIPADKITILHVNSIKRITASDIDVLFKVLNEERKSELIRRKRKIEEKEQKELQEEEFVVKALLGNK